MCSPLFLSKDFFYLCRNLYFYVKQRFSLSRSSGCSLKFFLAHFLGRNFIQVRWTDNERHVSKKKKTIKRHYFSILEARASKRERERERKEGGGRRERIRIRSIDGATSFRAKCIQSAQAENFPNPFRPLYMASWQELADVGTAGNACAQSSNGVARWSQGKLMLQTIQDTKENGFRGVARDSISKDFTSLRFLPASLPQTPDRILISRLAHYYFMDSIVRLLKYNITQFISRI